MTAIADIGATIKVTPSDDVWVKKDLNTEISYTDDLSPFCFAVEGGLYDGQIFYGV